MNMTECFKIQILENDAIFDISKGNVLLQLNAGRKPVIHEPKSILADPFLFVNDDTLYLFYEDKKMYKPGVISMICTKNLENWSKPVVVLQENFHLSYPWVFKYDRHIYMLPETSEAHSVRLYETENNKLSEFKYVMTLMENDDKDLLVDFSDTSIYIKDGIFYLMTTINENGVNQLELYLSDSLKGPYRKHPCSPISVSNKYGRNAGCMFELGGRLFRTAQDCEGRYGDDVNIFEVQKISMEEYDEQLYKENILAQKSFFYIEGGHHFNFVNFLGKNIIATDAKEYKLLLPQKLMHKLGFY
ncbi:MAG: glycoside hydrolase family 32 protein [Lachnospiraceae bacterium]|nr:glycoside hydrolase family 32 protein [Lachnospiraceae bacterium]